MPRHRDGLPSKTEVLEFIKSAGVKVGRREVARAFGIKGNDRIALRRLMSEMAQEGLLARRGKRVHQAGVLPPVIVADITRRDADGELIATPAEWDSARQGTAPAITLDHPRKATSPAPGVGDRILVRVAPDSDSSTPAHYTGRIIKLLDKGRTRLLGVIEQQQGGELRLIPLDKKLLGREYRLASEDLMGATIGDLVAVQLQKETRSTRPLARIVQKLGDGSSEKAVSQMALYAHDIPHIFSDELLREADDLSPATLSGREDWRSLPLITIDPADAKDHDDAVHVTEEGDGTFTLVVAIADVGWFVRPGTMLDQEALKRGNSVYFPDRVVPMLPERISNDLCSLRPQEERAALAVRLRLSAEGQKIGHSFHRILMKSAAKLSYPQAQAAMDGQPDEMTSPLLTSVLKPLWKAWHHIHEDRNRRGPLDLDLPDRKILLDAQGKVERIVSPPRLEAHRLIEDFMILANVAAAEELEARHTPLIWRVHDQPSQEKGAALREFLKTLDIALPSTKHLKTAQFNTILQRVKGTPAEAVVNEVVLRSQAQAEYSVENYGHFGLALPRYAHFTSPIRRYADLMVHRALITALDLGQGGLPAHTRIEEMQEIAADISVAERRAMAAERETSDRLIAGWLADRVGATFQGKISGISKSGLFVKLDESGADGFIPAATLGAEYFSYEPSRQMLAGVRSGDHFSLGDRVEVRLTEAVPAAGALRFEMLSPPRAASRSAKKSFKPHKQGKRRRDRS